MRPRAGRDETITTKASLHDKRAPGFLMEIVEKFVAARRERANMHRAFAAGRDHLLDPQRHAFEFHGRGIQVFHSYGQRPIGRRADFSRLKMMVLDGYGHLGGGLLRACAGAGGSDDRRREHRGGQAGCDRYYFRPHRIFLLSFPIRQGVTRMCRAFASRQALRDRRPHQNQNSNSNSNLARWREKSVRSRAGMTPTSRPATCVSHAALISILEDIFQNKVGPRYTASPVKVPNAMLS